jgi:CubicO group peptidase (beta-lactamase class C family)
MRETLMNRTAKLRRRFSLILILVASLPYLNATADLGEPDLAGLWYAQRIFGPVVSGPLLIRKSGEQLLADIGGQRVVVHRNGNALQFTLSPDVRFDGEVEADGSIRGSWMQPPGKLDGNSFATPVRLLPHVNDWYGVVTPQADTATFYLLLAASDGGLAAELINPERNLGVFYELTELVMTGNTVSIMGRFRGGGQKTPMLRGEYHADEDVLALRFPGRGGGYDFHRTDASSARGFRARTATSAVSPATPPTLNDGWQTATPAQVGMDVAVIEQMIRDHVLGPPTSTHDLSIHAILIARHGKLVFEEYFHGFHRDLPHDSRSASKSVTSILAAAIMQSGGELDWDTPVYPLFDAAELLDAEPARGNIQLQHLLNMNSGLDCDDRNPASAANEDYLWDNAGELDFYRHTLHVDVVRAPGEVAKYCSASANLAGGAIAFAANQDLLRLLDRLVAEPMDINHYSVPISPDEHPYMGGGIRWLPRDFLKFPQLLLDGGAWNGQRVLSRENARRLSTPVVKIDDGRDYGYLWWTVDYPFRERTVRAHFMGGNGGQIAMLVPVLQLGIVFNAGNYSDRVMFRIQEELIPEYILPSITD